MHIIGEPEAYFILKLRQNQVFELRINSQVNLNEKFSAVRPLCATNGYQSDIGPTVGNDGRPMLRINKTNHQIPRLIISFQAKG